MTWGIYETMYPFTGVVESIDVVPDEDLKPHVMGMKCWCKPCAIDEDDQEWITQVCHNSLDGREAYETGERKST